MVLADLSTDRLALLEEFFAERDVPTITIPPKADRPDLYYKVDGHWTATGHAYVADLILDALEQFNL